MKIQCIVLAVMLYAVEGFSQTIKFQKKDYEPKNVSASIVNLNGEKVLKVERDLKALPFDLKNLGATVDAPTYVKLKDLNFSDGVIEVKLLSRIQKQSTFEGAQGFIGVAYRIKPNDSAFEAIYLRPKVGRSENQYARNHTVQYFAYPDHKFDKLREEKNSAYETYADVALDEWITMRIEVHGGKAELFINNQLHPSFVVPKMKGSTTTGEIGLWVDIGTEGYFKDLKIIQQ